MYWHSVDKIESQKRPASIGTRPGAWERENENVRRVFYCIAFHFAFCILGFAFCIIHTSVV
jgi:hypothetical protein